MRVRRSGSGHHRCKLRPVPAALELCQDVITIISTTPAAAAVAAIGYVPSAAIRNLRASYIRRRHRRRGGSHCLRWCGDAEFNRIGGS